MKSFVVVNHHRQWKVSYGEHEYWKIGARWFIDHGTSLFLFDDAELVLELETNLAKIAHKWADHSGYLSNE